MDRPVLDAFRLDARLTVASSAGAELGRPRGGSRLLRLGGVCDPDGAMPRDMAASFRRRPGHLAALLRRMLDRVPERAFQAHGRGYGRDGAAELRRAFRTVP